MNDHVLFVDVDPRTFCRLLHLIISAIYDFGVDVAPDIYLWMDGLRKFCLCCEIYSCVARNCALNCTYLVCIYERNEG